MVDQVRRPTVSNNRCNSLPVMDEKKVHCNWFLSVCEGRHIGDLAWAPCAASMHSFSPSIFQHSAVHDHGVAVRHHIHQH
eukprot:11027338-Prorocentrum_lima.AAC.1